MSLLDGLEFCHCSLNQNLNELVRAIQGAKDARIYCCGDVPAERKERALFLAEALRCWLSGAEPPPEAAEYLQEAACLLGDHDDRKNELIQHLIKKLEDNSYQFYGADKEDFNTVESRIQHLEICCFNWENNLRILLAEIGSGIRKHPWNCVGGFCACGDQDAYNDYPALLLYQLDKIRPRADIQLLEALRRKLEEAEEACGGLWRTL